MGPQNVVLGNYGHKSVCQNYFLSSTDDNDVRSKIYEMISVSKPKNCKLSIFDYTN